MVRTLEHAGKTRRAGVRKAAGFGKGEKGGGRTLECFILEVSGANMANTDRAEPGRTVEPRRWVATSLWKTRGGPLPGRARINGVVGRGVRGWRAGGQAGRCSGCRLDAAMTSGRTAGGGRGINLDGCLAGTCRGVGVPRGRDGRGDGQGWGPLETRLTHGSHVWAVVGSARRAAATGGHTAPDPRRHARLRVGRLASSDCLGRKRNETRVENALVPPARRSPSPIKISVGASCAVSPPASPRPTLFLSLSHSPTALSLFSSVAPFLLPPPPAPPRCRMLVL